MSDFSEISQIYKSHGAKSQLLTSREDPTVEQLRVQLVKRMEAAFGVRASAVRLNYYRGNKEGGGSMDDSAV